MIQCLIAFGANQGDTVACFNDAIKRLSNHADIRLVRSATPKTTRAVQGKSDQERSRSSPPEAGNQYLNSAILVETTLPPTELFSVTARIESELGRQRLSRWGARSIDLDIILYGQQKLASERLTIPHPRMSFRKFVLDSAAEIASEMVDPISGVTVGQLWQRLNAKPNQILWLTEDVNQTQSRIDTVKANEVTDRWDFHVQTLPLKIPPRWPTPKLMIYDGVPGGYFAAARRFAGPSLNLSQCEKEFANREILAAIEAML